MFPASRQPPAVDADPAVSAPSRRHGTASRRGTLDRPCPGPECFQLLAGPRLWTRIRRSLRHRAGMASIPAAAHSTVHAPDRNVSSLRADRQELAAQVSNSFCRVNARRQRLPGYAGVPPADEPMRAFRPAHPGNAPPRRRASSCRRGRPGSGHERLPCKLPRNRSRAQGARCRLTCRRGWPSSGHESLGSWWIGRRRFRWGLSGLGEGSGVEKPAPIPHQGPK